MNREEYADIVKDCSCAIQLTCTLHIKAAWMYKSIKEFCAGMTDNDIGPAADAFELFQSIIEEIDSNI